MIVNCRRVTELLTEAREGEIADWERKHFTEHVQMCRPCRRYAEGFETTIALLHTLPEEPAPAAQREALLARFRKKGSPDDSSEGQ